MVSASLPAAAAVTQPAVTQPAVTQPVVTQAAVTQPAASGGISPRGVVHPPGAEPPPGAVVYLPSGTATTAASPGQQLAMGSQVANVQQGIVTAMTNSTRVSFPLNSGGVLVLDGATLAFVVLVQPSS